MGVLNTTPDSFSDGGRFMDVDAATTHTRTMARDGAAIIDVGGESTRPGAGRVAAEEQIKRVVPVVSAVRAMFDDEAEEVGRSVWISVDTTRAVVAEAALDAGADLINDVSAGREDEALLPLASARGVPVVLMHMLGQPATMQGAPRYDDVVDEVTAFLADRVTAAVSAGIAEDQVVVDPGIGFGKTLNDNLALLAALPAFVARFNGRVLLGTSRKSMFAKIDPTATTPGDRLPGTLATTALAVTAGVPLLRVHDVRENARAAEVACRIRAASAQPSD